MSRLCRVEHARIAWSLSCRVFVESNMHTCTHCLLCVHCLVFVESCLCRVEHAHIGYPYIYIYGYTSQTKICLLNLVEPVDCDCELRIWSHQQKHGKTPRALVSMLSICSCCCCCCCCYCCCYGIATTITANIAANTTTNITEHGSGHDGGTAMSP